MEPNEEALEELVRRLVAAISSSTARYLLADDEETPQYDLSAIDSWQEAVTNTIADGHMTAAILGEGKPMPSDAVMGAVAAALATQVGYLNDFANQLRVNAQNGQIGMLPADQRQSGYMTGPQIQARANMYAGAARAPYFIGFTGALPLPAMPTEGTLCFTNCKCSWNIVELDAEAGDVDAYWRRSATDSCQTCVIREQEWAPVRIRGGILEL